MRDQLVKGPTSEELRRRVLVRLRHALNESMRQQPGWPVPAAPRAPEHLAPGENGRDAA